MNLHMIRAVRLIKARQGGLSSAAFLTALDDANLSRALAELLSRRGQSVARSAVAAIVGGMSVAEATSYILSQHAIAPYIAASSAAMTAIAADSASVSDIAASSGAMAIIAASNTAMAAFAASSAAMVAMLSSGVSVAAIKSVPTALSKVMGSTALAKASVPTMTSNTAPKGVASARDFYDPAYAAWVAFDGDDASYWNSAGTSRSGSDWIAYKFVSDMCITSVAIKPLNAEYAPNNCRIEFSDNGTSFSTAATISVAADDAQQNFTLLSPGFHKHWRIAMLGCHGGQNYLVLNTVNFTGFVKP